MRTKFLDYDSRPEPKTSRWCCRCQRDIKQGSLARVVCLRVNDMHVIHPEDANEEGDEHLIGLDCAKVMGLEWSKPERIPS